MSLLKKINDLLMTIIRFSLIIFGTVMTFLVIMNVILRYVFNSGLSWSEEACRFLFIWVTFMGAMLANDSGFHGEHMRLDFVVEMFHGIPRKIIELFSQLIVLMLLVTLFLGGIQVVKSTWPFLTSALEIPKGAVYLIAPISFGYMILQTVVRIVRIIKASDDDMNHKEA